MSTQTHSKVCTQLHLHYTSLVDMLVEFIRSCSFPTSCPEHIKHELTRGIANVEMKNVKDVILDNVNVYNRLALKYKALSTFSIQPIVQFQFQTNPETPWFKVMSSLGNSDLLDVTDVFSLTSLNRRTRAHFVTTPDAWPTTIRITSNNFIQVLPFLHNMSSSHLEIDWSGSTLRPLHVVFVSRCIKDRIRKVSLEQCRGTCVNDVLGVLQACPNLHVLNLYGTRLISHRNVVPFPQSVRKLNLGCYMYTHPRSTLEELVTRLPPNLKSLHIVDVANHFSMEYLFSIISKLPLTHISLDYLESPGTNVRCSMLTNTLESLAVLHGGANLANQLRHLTNLKTLCVESIPARYIEDIKAIGIDKVDITQDPFDDLGFDLDPDL